MQDVMFYFYLVIGIAIQATILFAYPIYLLAKNKQSIAGWWFVILNAIWSLYIYYDIWLVFNRPDEWSVNTPGFVLGGYALFGPLLIWFVHAPIYILCIVGTWAFNKSSKRDAASGAPS